MFIVVIIINCLYYHAICQMNAMEAMNRGHGNLSHDQSG